VFSQLEGLKIEINVEDIVTLEEALSVYQSIPIAGVPLYLSIRRDRPDGGIIL
jgi:hypothetical protein